MIYRYLLHTTILFLIFNFSQAQQVTVEVQKEKDAIRLSKTTRSIRNKIDSIKNTITNTYREIDISADSLHRTQILAIINNLEIEVDNLRIQRMKKELKFVKKNPNAFFSLEILNLWFRRQESFGYADTIISIFYSLKDQIKKSKEGKAFAMAIDQFNKSKVGSEAPNFLTEDMNGQELSLSSFKNKKYVLLDFWASWCGPCRAEIPSLKKIYSSYNPNDLEVIGISEDNDPAKWKEAIFKDKTAMWSHILAQSIVINNNYRILLNDYFIHGIPEKILINKDGKIIGRWKGGGEENMKSIAEMLNNIFEKVQSKYHEKN